MRNLLILAVVLIAAGCTGTKPIDPNDNVSVDTGITKTMCDNAGGHWNECGSACRGAPPGTACTMNCVFYCECGGNYKCPAGYVCSDYLPKGASDAMGICKKVSE